MMYSLLELQSGDWIVSTIGAYGNVYIDPTGMLKKVERTIVARIVVNKPVCIVNVISLEIMSRVSAKDVFDFA